MKSNLRSKKTFTNPLECPLYGSNQKSRQTKINFDEEDLRAKSSSSQSIELNKSNGSIDWKDGLHLLEKEIIQQYGITKSEEPIEIISGSFQFSYNSTTFESKVTFAYLCLTNFRVIFHTKEKFSPGANTQVTDFNDKFQIPIGYVRKISKFEDKLQSKLIIYLEIRDQRAYKYYTSFDSDKLYFMLFSRVFPSLRDKIFAFNYKVDFISHYKPFNLQKEMERLGFFNSNMSEFAIDTTSNDNFKISSKYPKFIIVPAKYNGSPNLKKVSDLFYKGRIPIMTWFNKATNATLWVCSAFKGIPDLKSKERLQEYLHFIKNNSKLSLIDVSKISKEKSGDIEDCFKFDDKIYSDLHDYEKVRKKFQKIKQIYKHPEFAKTPLTCIENTRWLEMLASLIESATSAAFKLHSKENVIISGHEGRDRTLQVSFLTQLIKDPYYRTVRGFACLLDKELLYLCHPFNLRLENLSHMFGKIRKSIEQKQISHSNKAEIRDESSPIFLQLIDCVYQLLIQFPSSFEFNADMLEFLAYHSFSNKYGTFLYDCELEREADKLSSKVYSIWTDIIGIGHSRFKNNFYEIDSKYNKRPIFPVYSCHRMKLWNSLLFKFSDIEEKETTYDRIIHKKKQDKKLLSKYRVNKGKLIGLLKSKNLDLEKLQNKLSLKALITLKHSL